MKYLLFCAAFFTLLASGCSIEQRIENREDRLMGDWFLDRAFFHEDGALFRDNVTSDFRGDEITFLPDFTLIYRAGDGLVYDGYWEISALRDQEDGDSDIDFLIDADFFFPNGEIAFSWIGQIERLGNNDFNVRLQQRTGELVMKWDKI